ncbi:MAG TPA: UDP-3-O-(3-hydroxymyristoyl)glucosamine N-acyltransferase [Flavipsychrobacter sp.]|nr:UDP-3-O-(3-hydroxymyristoyl)glucosamine N-acyltransferase [Flavipsychrobacter sp.]
MQFTAQQIATILNGKIEGNPDVAISTVAKIEEAVKGTLSFIANPKYEEYIYTSKASIVIINESMAVEGTVSPTLIRVKDAYSSFALLMEKYNDMVSGGVKSGVEAYTFISSTASIGKNVYVGAFSYIGENVVIGDNVKIYPGCFIGDDTVVGNDCKFFAGTRIYNQCVIGNNVITHSGTIIGGDGFGFAPLADGTYKKIPQIGNVIIEDNVEIGANTTIDRATMGSTIIRKGVKLDNLIQVAHNVEIGANTVIAAQTGISGSTRIGTNCKIGGQVGIVGHIQIADGTNINAQSGVSKSVTESNTTLSGSPAFEYKSSLKSQAIFRNLPELSQRIQKLEDTIRELSELLGNQNIEVKK